MQAYRVTKNSYLNERLYKPGDIVELADDVRPGSNLEPIDRETKKKVVAEQAATAKPQPSTNEIGDIVRRIEALETTVGLDTIKAAVAKRAAAEQAERDRAAAKEKAKTEADAKAAADKEAKQDAAPKAPVSTEQPAAPRSIPREADAKV